MQHLSSQEQRTRAQLASCGEPHSASFPDDGDPPDAEDAPALVGDVVAWRAKCSDAVGSSGAEATVDILDSALIEGRKMLHEFVAKGRAHHGELTPSEVGSMTSDFPVFWHLRTVC